MTNLRSSFGSVMLLVIVFGAIFFTILVALSGFVLSENRAQEVTREKNEAFGIAEAGLEYYRWFLSHFPGNTQNGTGHAGPYQISYSDPEGGTAGTYTLSIAGNTSCGQPLSIDVTSVGSPAEAPGVTQTLWARYAEPSVAAYSYIINSSVWFGSTIYGPLHSNGGIRMDGNPNADVSSSLLTWTCDASFGCSPSATKPGVFGSGTNQNLWKYPTPQTDFAGIAADFSSLKNIATSSGLYFSRYSSGNGGNAYYKGYHLVFNADGTVTIYKVGSETVLQSVPLDNPNAGLTNDYTLIKNETLVGTYTIPTSCGLIFVEDHVWVEGAVKGKVTLVAADVTHPGVTPYAVLKNNIQYAAYDGTSGLTLISAGDVLIAPDAPANLTLNGIFIAQSGAYGRNLYTCANTSYANKSTLTLLGTTVSNLRPGTYWSYSGYGCSGSQTSGYPIRTSSFDRQNATNPPPFTPITSTQYEFVDWQER